MLTFSTAISISDKVELLANYTYSKGIDNTLIFTATDTRVIDPANNPLNIGDERGFSVQDLRHRFVLSSNIAVNFSKNIFYKIINFL